MVFRKDEGVTGWPGVAVEGKAPTIGSDDNGRLAIKPVGIWIGWDERGEDGPLGVSQVGWVVRQGRSLIVQ